MESIEIGEYSLPDNTSEILLDFINDYFEKYINKIYIVPVIKKPNCSELKCHLNVEKYVNSYGGQKILGYYFIVNNHNNKIIGIKHSIWKNTYGNLIDITPFSDNRRYNIFFPYPDAKDKIINS